MNSQCDIGRRTIMFRQITDDIYITIRTGFPITMYIFAVEDVAINHEP